MTEDNQGLRKLPEGWAWTLLGEIHIDRSRAITPKKSPEEMFELYSVPSFDNGEPEIVSGKQIGSNKQVVDEETVLLCKINPRINRVWIVGDRSPHMKIASTEWIPFFKQEEVNPKYLSYFMRNSDFRAFLSLNVSGVGGSLMRIKASTIAEYPVPLAPFNEQRRIVARLEELFTCLDAGVEGLRKVKAQLKRYRQAVLKYAFDGKLTEEWRKTYKDQIEPATKLLDRIKQERKKDQKYEELPQIDTSELPEIPEDWVWTRVGVVGEIVTGKTPRKSHPEYYGRDYPFFKPTDLNAGFYTKSSIDGLSKSGIRYARLLPEKTVLVTCIGATIGKTGLTRIEGACNQQINAIIVDRQISPEFVYFMCVSPQLQKSIITEASATTLPILNKSRFELLPIPMPSRFEQQQIVEEVEHCFSEIETVEKIVEQSLERAVRLRQSVLKRAFEGKLVAQDPSDEPAEKLLERIREERAKSKGEKDFNKKKTKLQQLELSTYVK